MRGSEVNLRADKLATAIRWFILMGFSLQIAAGGGLSTELNVLMVLAGLWNLSLTGLTLVNWRLPYHSEIVLGLDFVLSAMLFYFGGGSEGTLNWTGLLPVLLTALYYGPQLGLYVAGVAIVLQSITSWVIYGDILDMLAAIAPVLLVYLGVGGVAGYISVQIGKQIRPSQDIVGGLKKMGERVEKHRLQAIYRITSTLSSTLNYERILDLALDLSVDALTDPDDTAAHLVSAFFLYETDKMHVGSARRFTNADLRVTLAGKEGVVGQAIDERQMKITQDPIHDPEISPIVALHSCHSVLCYPLRGGLDVYGVLLFGHPEPDYFDEGRQEILEIIGRQAQSSIVNARLYRDLEQEKARMMEIQEEGRKQLARNLHDGPTQSVAAIAMRVNFARRLIERDVKGAADELFKIESLARRTTKEIRHMLFTLRPLVLESSGLKAALESMAAKMKETYNQNVIVDVDPESAEQLEMGKQGVIFYIAEEAVNNARKHAEAQHISVRLKSGEQDIVILEIQDDGVGFNIGAVDSGYENRGSLGMVNMRERTELVNGVLELDSEEGKGTRVRVWIPLTEDAADKIRHAP